MHFEHIWCFSVRHSMLHHNQGAGLYIDGWDAFILDNWFSGNQGGGIMGGAYTASVTCTGNRVEWNWTGGFVFRKGDSFNITGNFFDRSFGPALWLKQAGNVTVTGNIFRRSGAFDTPFELDSMNCHVLLEQCRETVITGNTMKKGVGDNGEGVLSPHHAMILDGCKSCIVKLNILSNSCVGEAIVIPKHDFEGILDENI